MDGPVQRQPTPASDPGCAQAPSRQEDATEANLERNRPAIGCVGFLNSLPLIDGLDQAAARALGDARGGRCRVHLDVPSRMLGLLEAGTADLALCPIIDYQRSSIPLAILPAGGIACHGRTLTVRLYSRIPPDRIDRVHADTDSHTSIVLLRVLLDRCYGRRPHVVPLEGPGHQPAGASRGKGSPRNGNGNGSAPEAMLLIGDKVVTAPPPTDLYPHQLDLGETWRELMDMPFIFAVWMARPGAELGHLPRVLAEVREHNLAHLDDLVARHAAAHGWPAGLARRYLGHWLRYRIGPDELEAMQRFWREARAIGAIEHIRPLQTWAPPTAAEPIAPTRAS